MDAKTRDLEPVWLVLAIIGAISMWAIAAPANQNRHRDGMANRFAPVPRSPKTGRSPDWLKMKRRDL